MKFFLAATTVLILLDASVKEAFCTNNRTEAELLLIEALESPLPSTHNATMTKPLKAVSEPILQPNATTSLNAKRTCACDDTEETPICASNGVTYKNGCRFECAKARVSRLRQIKQGRCSQATGASSFWQSKKSG
ncbi:putative protein-related modular calcium-binding protein 1 [Orchesella cincta]|uniref:Kazal-like domain-containing protein n=1 Tax=Orchesella cincta TaxID=48709 RepID=A0A1D2N140_ORCCI|nr:putative protein-related modular calcium-binding protein 1 [Orchesella cincta]